MKNRVALVCIVFLLPILGFSQGIRKNFTEMTDAEKSAYVSALNSISYNYDDMVRALTYYYIEHFDDFYNSPCSQNQYLFFHRMALWEMENAIQHQNPQLTVPYWDWLENGSPDDPLLTSFLSQEHIPANWEVWRQVAYDGTLPSYSEISTTMSSDQFCNDDNYYSSFESQAMQTMGYNSDWWVGGTLGMHLPSEPLFFLTHATIDRYWQQWQMSTYASWAGSTTMDRYDGVTSSQYVSPLPAIDPSTILDSRNMGIFYADYGVVYLDGYYNVQNTYMDPEQFFYQYDIVATNFTVPNGKNAVFTSLTSVTLNSGFEVYGTLQINVGPGNDNFPMAKKTIGSKSAKQNGFASPLPALEDKLTITRSPNGFTAHLALQKPEDVEGYLMGIDGKIISRFQSGHMDMGAHNVEIHAPTMGTGLYYGYFRVGKTVYKQLLPKF